MPESGAATRLPAGCVPFDPRLVAALDQEIADRQRVLEEQLTNGPAELSRIRDEILRHRADLRSIVEHAHHTLLQAEADLNAAKG